MAAFVVQGTPLPAPLARPQSHLGGLTAFVARHVRAGLKVRKDRHQLHGLSDRMLADLGLSRSDIE